MRLEPWLLLLIPAVRAAYAQFKQCDGALAETKGPDKDQGLFDFDVDSLRASIQDLEDGSESRIQLTISGLRRGASSCEDLDPKEGASTTLRLATLGSSVLYAGQLENQTCTQYSEEDTPQTKRIFNYDVPRPHLLDGFFLTVEVEGHNDTGVACLKAPLTPAVDSIVTDLSTWIPACILLLAVVAALWRETANLSSEDPSDPDQLGLSREPSRTHITRVADCISYLQFIFFSSALSLHYPGFLQPVTSRMSWSTLMLPAGVVVRDPWYDGVKDGIYEINGTFGGTAGLELMTQVMGGTVTTDTWLNTAALAAMVFMLLTGIVVLGQRLTWARDWFQATHSLVFRDGQSNFRATMWTTFRLFCSYLLMPLVAWSAYVVGQARQNSIYHTVAATAVICVLILILWWTMSQGRPRNMGYLLLDGDKEHQNPTALSRTHDLYSTGMFILLFFRGATIGGLQVVGTVQFIILMTIEIVQLILHTMVYRATPYSSRTGAMPMIRLVVLAFEAGFLPDAAGHGSKMALGYTILLIHIAVLLVLFLMPTIWELLKLSRDSLPGSNSTIEDDADSHSQVFGLRQLMRRPTNPPNRRLSPSASGSSEQSPPRLPIPPSRPSSTLPPNASPSPIDGSYYFRPPRLSSAELLSRASIGTSVPESYTSSTPEASFSDRSEPSSCGGPRNGSSPLTKRSEAEEEEGWTPSPSDPRVDYSVREADKYYVRPRRLSFRKATRTEDGPSEQRGGFTSRISSLWTK